MKSKDLDLSIYKDSELVPVYKTETKLQILKKYLKDKEQKFKKAADTAGVTAVISGFITPLTATAIGLGFATNPEVINTPSALALGVITATGVAANIISFVSFKKNRAKQSDFKQLREFIEAGISDHKKFEKVKETIKEEGTDNLSTLEKINNIITPNHKHYCNPDNLVAPKEELEMQS